MSEDVALPSSPKAEQALLGILLYDNAAIERVPLTFKPEHMFDGVHGRLCKSIMSVVQSGGTVDPIMLQERFADDEGFRSLGGFRYLADLVDHAPASSSTGDFCRLISDLAVRRELIQMSAKIAKAAAADRETPALAQVDELEKKLFDLATSREESGPQGLGDVLGSTLEMAASAYARDGALAGQPTGLADLDKKLGGLPPSGLIILAARPSMGKTSLAVNIALHNALTYAYEEQPDGSRKVSKGGVAAFFSLEMSADQIGLRILSDVANIDSKRITGGEIDATEFGQLRDAALEIRDAPLYIDATAALSLSALATRCRRLKRTVGLDIVVIDYLQLMTLAGDHKMQRAELISTITQGLKALAKELDIPIVALSQLTRKVEERPDKRPQLADLKESGAIEQDADIVMFVYRHAYYLEKEVPKEGSAEHLKWEEELDKCRNEAEIIIGKQRAGPVGSVKVAFKGETTKFSDLPKEEPGGY